MRRDAGVVDAQREGSPEGGLRDAPVLRESGVASSPAWLLGYYLNAENPLNGGSFPVSAIDFDALTHIAAAFYRPSSDGNWEASSFSDALGSELISAAHLSGKKALASIGGSGSGPGFEGATQTSAHLTLLLGHLADLVTLGYDGFDIDWEGGTLTASEDDDLERLLIEKLRAAYPSAILTITAPFLDENVTSDLSFYRQIAPLVDRIDIITYGMAGKWAGWDSWHSSPLHWNHRSETPSGIDASVLQFLAAGVPRAQLGIGAGFHGECYTAPVVSPVEALGKSEVIADDNGLSYANIMTSYYSASAYHYDSMAEVPYLTLANKNALGCTYLTYEDPRSLAAKAAWVKEQDLGAVIIWTVGEGYLSSGGATAAANPLLETLRSSLY